MKVEVVTTAHDADDRRLRWMVDVMRSHGIDADLRAATFRSRATRFLLGPWWVGWRTLASPADSIIVPDPEAWLPAALLGRARRRHVVLDIHEEYHLTAQSRGWIPDWARGVVAGLATRILTIARRSASAVVAADEHLARPGDLVVRNLPDVRPSGDRERRPTAVYVGSVSRQRGVGTIVDLALASPEWTFWIIGPDAEGADTARRRAPDNIEWHGPLRHDLAWKLAARAWVGLSLLGDEPAYRRALPTKLVEYLGAGLAVVVSDLPRQAALVDGAGAGFVVSTTDEAAAALQRFADLETARAMGERGRAAYERLVGADDAEGRLLEAISHAR
jgi:glycosyltransferase involved in cell wall biosynthesis